MSFKKWWSSWKLPTWKPESSSDELESKAEEEGRKDLRTSDSEPEERNGCRALRFPGYETQKEEIKQLLEQGLDARYRIGTGWWNQWKKYVGYDQCDRTSAGLESANPGPMTDLIESESDTLKDDLMEDTQHTLLPEPVWEKLALWYGVSDQSPPNERKSTNEDNSEHHVKSRKSERSLLRLKLGVYSDCKDDTLATQSFSYSDTIANLESTLKHTFDVPNEVECRLWKGSTALLNSKQTLMDAGLIGEETIILERRNADGKWPKESNLPPDKSFFSSVKSSVKSLAKRLCGQPQPTPLGLRGLVNIGNTCFMNSALQCLSNAQPLREYFVGEGTPYKRHLHLEENPLGSGGAIAEAYGMLMQHMWSGKATSIKPQQMKEEIEKYSSQFTGYAQQDSQELLTVLLDGIHDDLNLMKTTPYFDTTINAKGRTDEDIAEESWYNHLRRNQSVIVKVFRGQQKSTLACSLCQKDTKVFDPFTFLSLPLPIDELRNICIHLIKTEKSNHDVEIHTYKLKVIEQACVFNLKRVLSRLTGISTNMMVVDVYNSDSRIHHICNDSEPLSQISDAETDIFVLELGHPLEDEDWIQVAVYHESLKGYYRLPMMVSIPRKQYTDHRLYDTVRDRNRIHTKTRAEEEANPTHQQKPGNTDGIPTCGIGTPVDEEAMEVNQVEMKAPEKVDTESVAGERETDLFKLSVINCECDSQLQQLKTYSSHTMKMFISCNWTQEVYDFNTISPTHTIQESNIHLMDCLDLFTAKQTIASWYCPECTQSVQASRKCDLWKLPEILIIYLKRFSYNGRQKINEKVDFPICGLDLAPYVQNPYDPVPIYDLFATTNHFGGLAGGHYTATCKNSETGKWYLFDDTYVTEREENHVGTSTAYILFYHRRSSHRIDYLSLFDAEICKLEAKFNSTTCNPLEAEEGEKLEERNQQVADDGMENEIRAKRKRKARGGGNKRKRRKGNKRKERKRGKKRKNKRGRKKRKLHYK